MTDTIPPRLANLPDLPQVPTLREVVRRLWADATVRAIWLGGSFASNKADAYSDVDLRIAVSPDALNAWHEPRWREVLGQDAIGGGFTAFGDDAFLHHLVLEDGSIFDVFVQHTRHDNFERAVRVLVCRDDAFAQRLESFQRPAPAGMVAAATGSIDDARQLLITTWVNAHKHRKVLARGLPMVAIVGIQAERMSLVRLLYLLHAGRDLAGRPTIHGLTAVNRTLAEVMGPRLLEIVGMPLRNEREIVTAIEAQQQELIAVGRSLAERVGFEYPERLEATVRREWARFVADGDTMNTG